MTGWHIEHHAQAASTNSLAINMICRHFENDEPVAPTIILADTQTAGRGQYDRQWHSPAGNMYATFILPDVAIAFRPLLPIYAGLAAWRAIRALSGMTALFKWPNDLLVADLKLAGLLVEAVAAGPHWAAAIGIGINLNTKKFPADIAATSLAQCTGRDWDPRTLAMSVAYHMDVLEAPESILGTYRQYDALLGRELTITAATESITGTGAGINDDGHLRVSTASGEKLISTGTIRFADTPKTPPTKKRGRAKPS